MFTKPEWVSRAVELLTQVKQASLLIATIAGTVAEGLRMWNHGHGDD